MTYIRQKEGDPDGRSEKQEEKMSRGTGKYLDKSKYILSKLNNNNVLWDKKIKLKYMMIIIQSLERSN